MPIALVRLVAWGIVGGLALALGAVLTRHMKEQALRRRVMIAFIVSTALALNYAVISPMVVETWKDHSARTPVERVARYLQRALEAKPEFTAWLRAQTAAGKTRDAALAEGAVLSARGVRRLEDERLLRRTALMASALERVDSHTCAVVLFGRATRDDLEHLFAAFDDGQLREYAAFGAEAMLRELRGSPPARAPIGEGRVDSIMNAVAAVAPEEFPPILQAAFVPGATDADRCSLTRFLFSHAPKVQGREQLDLAVLLMNQ